jgi:hypothetical protein
MSEIWKNIPGYPEIYKVSNLGRIKKGNKIRTFKTDVKSRYIRTSLNGKKVDLHILIAKAFLGPRPSKKHHVDHIDNDSRNNKVENLRWATVRENVSKERRNANLYTSKYTGVHRERGGWVAQIVLADKNYYLGKHEKEKDAAAAYKQAFSDYVAEGKLPKSLRNPTYVSYKKQSKKWIVTFKRKQLGSFNTEEDAFNFIRNYCKENGIEYNH